MELKGKEYWRSLEQLSRTDRFEEFLENEFPKGTSELAGNNNWSRRSFLTTMGASLALAGLTGCRRPVEKIVPYVTRPEGVDPGVPNYYATTMPLGLSAYGIVVTTYEGRPTFVRGNEQHPSSRGGVNPLVQASLLDLYDPDRSKSVLRNGKKSKWDDLVAWWKEQHANYTQNGGEGLAVLSETFNSPTLARLKREFFETFPRAKWFSWEPISDENIYTGIKRATGEALQPVYEFSKARIILALDCDFLGTESEAVANTRGFAEGRRVMSQSDNMNRLYVVEPSMTATGMMADHRVKSSRSQVGSFLTSLAGVLTQKGVNTGFSGENSGFDAKLLDVLADELTNHRGESLIVAGRSQPSWVHELCVRLNDALGNTEQTVNYYGMPDASPSDSAAFASLVGDMEQGKVETLFLLGGNHVYNVPTDLNLETAIQSVKEVVHLASHVDETSATSSWHIPRAHYLESWGDVRSADGIPGVMQPMIEPIHGAYSDVEAATLLVTGAQQPPLETVQETWKSGLIEREFDKSWSKVLHDGVFSGGSLKPTSIKLAGPYFPDGRGPSGGIEIAFAVSSVFDGRYANNGWLQELPDPVTKLTWGNAAIMSPKLAKEHDLENEDVVDLRGVTLPVWISPGQADNTISIALGYGRTEAGRVGNGVGVDVRKLRITTDPWYEPCGKITKTGRKHKLACTQDHGSMEGRPIVRENTLTKYKERAEFFPAEIEHPEPLSLWNEHKYEEGYQWGMSIDLNACTGCNACVIGCQAENNIPVIGKKQVREGREMHWMRIDRYYAGDVNDPEVAVQPMHCQHCEMAPCEQVCPVAATTHDEEGLNVMVYNRCIGTRYCSNNCPYKVRRFNFFNYTNELPETVQMAQNPEVTVRFRGVMEKCTYCTQRIAIAKIDAKNQGREVADGEIKTACEQACPAGAIVFGNINDPESRVSKLRENNRKYRVLEELNTRPRTTYLAKLRNPNPELVSDDTKSHGGHS